MNPQSERDRSIERLLRESLATVPGTGSCLDAEMLAAWVEGGLVGGQLIAAQEHVAGCSACQATLAALVRTTPTELGPEPWWRRALSARWLVPVAATATALAIWVLVPREEFMRPPEQLQTTAAREAAVPQTEQHESPRLSLLRSSAAGSPIVARRPFEQPNAELRRDRVQGAARQTRGRSSSLPRHSHPSRYPTYRRPLHWRAHRSGNRAPLPSLVVPRRQRRHPPLRPRPRPRLAASNHCRGP